MPREIWYQANKEKAQTYQREYMKSKADRKKVNEYHKNYYHTVVKPSREALTGPRTRGRMPDDKPVFQITTGNYILTFD
jgi:hypothetical protein